MNVVCSLSADLPASMDARDILRQLLPGARVWGRRDFAEAYVKEETNERDCHRPQSSPSQPGK